ncbi:MAG: FMN-binding protein, partial [Eudoraea sp.]|nr:FMN-binding protein [Eudoraea sp.]
MSAVRYPELVPNRKFPVSGKGLWSTLYGYFALEPDAKTVRGITFYQHGETPGLGAEIEKDWFQSKFAGKKLFESGQPTEFRVTKPGSASGDYAVDGISGATLTAKGVESLLRHDAALYAG